MGDAQAGFDQVGSMSQALRQGRIPPLPGQLPFGTDQPAPPPMAAMPGVRPPAEAMALLVMFLRLPQLLSALQSAAVLGPAGPRTMELPIPIARPTAGVRGVRGMRGMRNLQVPLGAVMNAIATLAGRSMEELNASTQESDPEVPDYLVGEDGELLVDPASAEERAALLTHMVRLNQAGQRAGWSAWAREAREADDELDEAEAWARDAGF